jgi:hypothetical protein
MSEEFEDLHFRHTLKSGRQIRLSVHRKKNTKPQVIGDSVKKLPTDDIREYLLWRQSVVATMMAKLTPGEVLACAEYGHQKTKKK